MPINLLLKKSHVRDDTGIKMSTSWVRKRLHNAYKSPCSKQMTGELFQVSSEHMIGSLEILTYTAVSSQI